ncbi:MAG TPA: hypothetical protein VG734_14070 [Lacunisphaera sp.]|nr:hypothetical protein [Lacunisphaera sp.]
MPASVTRFRRPAFALFLLVAALGLRWPSLGRQVWNLDEGSTITMAQLVLAGRVPYRDAADNRTPLVPYLKAAVLAVAGDWNARAIHLVVALMLGVTAILLWLIARQQGEEPTGVIAALLFTWLAAGYLPPIDGMTAHTGWFVIFFSSLGFWLFGESLARASARLALASGTAFGFSCLAKQPGLFDFGVCLVLLALLAGFDARPRARLAPLAGALLAGLCLPLILTVAYFLHRGALADLIFYTWTYNTKYYVAEVPWLERLWAVRVPFVLMGTRLPVILVVGLLAAWSLLRVAFSRLWQRAAGTALLAWLILGWSASGFVSTVLSGRDFNHYSIQVIPGICLACGWWLARARERVRAWHAAGWTARCWMAQLAGLFAAISIVWPIQAELRQLGPDDRSGREVGQLVQSFTRRQDLIFVWGYVPEMHVYARRLPNTRYFYTNWVTGLIPWTNLDWLKDTRYAVIPRAPEILRQDFDRNPPAVVVDTGTNRGYLKYPLQEQAWLWSKIQHEFAEIDPKFTTDRGYRVYRRIADAPYGAAPPAGLPPDPQLKVEVTTLTRPETTPVRVTYPAGTTSVELYKDDELYRRIECPADQAGTVVFFALGSDLPAGERRLAAVARGSRVIASPAVHFLVDPALPVPRPPGPPLVFNRESYPPLEATNVYGMMRSPGKTDRWGTQVPSKIVYERPPGLSILEVEFGMDEDVYEHMEQFKTDGIEAVAQFQPRSGEVVTLFRKYLNPQIHGRDRGPQTERITLPPNEPGRIILWMSPGPLSDASSDAAYWRNVRGDAAPGALFFRDQRIPAIHVSSPHEYHEFELEGSTVFMIHAPSQLDFPLRRGMHRLSGTFGLLPTAWTGPKKSAGAFFEIWHVPPHGDIRLLREQRVDPAQNPAQRGPVSFSIELPYPQEGLLRLITRPAHPQDNAFNFTYWGPLVAEDFSAVLQTPDQPIHSSAAEAEYGLSDIQEEQRNVVFAHAPSRLTFPVPPGLRQLTGQAGLLAGAYAGAPDDATKGGRFIVEAETAPGQRTVVWQRDLNPREIPADRGFIPFSVRLPPATTTLFLRTEARPGCPLNRAWTFWHQLRLDP